LHGDEITGPEVVRRVLEGVDPEKLRGRLRLVPVANPLAFQTLTRVTPGSIEISNLNRVFPADPTLDLAARRHPSRPSFDRSPISSTCTPGDVSDVDYTISLPMSTRRWPFGQGVAPVDGYAGTMGRWLPPGRRRSQPRSAEAIIAIRTTSTSARGSST
jgi:hypothetical protein